MVGGSRLEVPRADVPKAEVPKPEVPQRAEVHRTEEVLPRSAAEALSAAPSGVPGVPGSLRAIAARPFCRGMSWEGINTGKGY